ncbi:Bacterial regulatory protein, Fis family [compost metagenome]
MLRSAIGVLHPLTAPSPSRHSLPVSGDFQQARLQFERQFISSALAEQGGNVDATARQLRMGRSTLYKKMAALGILS